MAVVVNENEVVLNDVHYPIKGKVQPVLASVFPDKQVIGDYSKDTDPVMSTWIIANNSSGSLIEELNEANPAHQNRCWYSSADIRFPGNMTLPPLATAITQTHIGMALVNADMELTTGWTATSGTGVRSSTQAYEGTYSWAVSGVDSYSKQVITWSDSYRSKKIKFWCWVWTAYASEGKLMVVDSEGDTSSSWHTGGSGWELLSVEHTVDASATSLELRLCSTAELVYFDNAASTIHGKMTHGCNYNSDLYFSVGNTLYKIANADGALSVIRAFVTTITALVASEGNHLYIFLGDDHDYHYMDTAGTITKTNIDDGTLAIHWDNILFKMDSAGAMTYSADPSSATPAWTATGSLADEGIADGDVNSLFIYRDASGNHIIYAATKVGLFAHDHANTKWTETELSLPNHPTCGMGAVNWRDAAYVSAGLSVYKYVAAGTATIEAMGLDQDDGLPIARSGEITSFEEGYNELFAFVDGTYTSATQSSQIMAYSPQRKWHCWWIGHGGSEDAATGGLIVSSAYAHRLWFGVGASIYYIPLQRAQVKPKSLSTYTYGLTGRFTTPWFDANWANGDKLALRVKVKVSDALADNETVAVSYRIDHTVTGLGASFTALGTISADGVTTYSFASGVGVVFKSIQFYVVLSRGNTTTSSPNVEWISLEYVKNIPSRWAYRFTVDCSSSYGKKTPEQLLAALKTAIETQTLINFAYTNGGSTTTYKGRVTGANSEQQTGEDNWGAYDLSFVVLP